MNSSFNLLLEDVLELINIVREEHSTIVYTRVLKIKEEVVQSLKTLVGGILLSMANHVMILKLYAETAQLVSVLSPAQYVRIVKRIASITRISGKFVGPPLLRRRGYFYFLYVFLLLLLLPPK